MIYNRVVFDLLWVFFKHICSSALKIWREKQLRTVKIKDMKIKFFWFAYFLLPISKNKRYSAFIFFSTVQVGPTPPIARH